MCGIGGIVKAGNTPIESSQISALLYGLETRGREAAGICLIDERDWQPQIFKDGRSATSLVESKAYSDFLEAHLNKYTKVVLAHTRWGTKGSSRENKNNHPVFDGKSAVVHNGCIANDTELFKSDSSLTRKAEVDTDIIRALVDKDGLTHKGVRQLNKLNGSCAAAIVSKDFPGYLMLLRSGNPLFVGQSEEFTIWASIKKTAAIASSQWRKVRGMWCQYKQPDMHYTEFPADTAWMLGPAPADHEEVKAGRCKEGDTILLWHQEFKSCNYTHSPYSNWNDYDNWEGSDGGGFGTCGRTFGPKETARLHVPMASGGVLSSYDTCMERVLVCPNHHCSARLAISAKAQKKMKKEKLRCNKCGTNLKNATELWTARRASC